MKIKIFIFILSLLVYPGCTGSNSLISEDILANEGWRNYKINNIIHGDLVKIEIAYYEGFNIGFNDISYVEYTIRPSEESDAYDAGYKDGTRNRTKYNEEN